MAGDSEASGKLDQLAGKVSNVGTKGEEAEIEDLKRIMVSLIGPAERSIDYYVVSEQLAKHVKQLEGRLGISRPYAGVQ